MEDSSLPLYKQPLFWIGLVLVLIVVLATWFSYSALRPRPPPAPAPVADDQIQARKDLFKALSPGRPLTVSDPEREQLIKELIPPEKQNITSEERNKLGELLR